MICITLVQGLLYPNDQTNLNNLVAWEGKERDVSSIASHQVTIKHPKNTLVSNDKQIVLLSFQL
jgi:hypothetical protein